MNASFTINREKLLKATHGNVRRLARFLNLSTEGGHVEVVDRVFVTLQRREKSEAEKAAYAQLWENLVVGQEDLPKLFVGVPKSHL